MSSGALNSLVSQRRRREGELQTLGTRAIGTLFVIVRNVRMHTPDNEIFAQPLETLRDVINAVVDSDLKFELQAAGTLLALNGYLLKVDFSALAHVRHLTNELRARDVGGFYAKDHVQLEDLVSFLLRFNGDRRPEEEDAPTRSDAIRSVSYREVAAKFKEQTDQQIEAERQNDPRKYAMTVYARAVYFMRRFLAQIGNGQRLPSAVPAARIIRDFVDVCRHEPSLFWGLTCTRNSGDYLPFHSVNTALLCIAMGDQLALRREQLLDLGKAGLFHDVGAASMDPAIQNKQGALSDEERAIVRRNPLYAVKRMLRSRPLDLSILKCALAAKEAKQHFTVVRPDAHGQPQAGTPRDLGLFGRIIRIASCYDALTSARPYREALPPETALGVMHTQMKQEFDPVLLEVFIAVLRERTRVEQLGGSPFRLS